MYHRGRSGTRPDSDRELRHKGFVFRAAELVPTGLGAAEELVFGAGITGYRAAQPGM